MSGVSREVEITLFIFNIDKVEYQARTIEISQGMNVLIANRQS
jgi:hypothetical protein